MVGPSFWNSGLFCVSRRSRKEEGTAHLPHLGLHYLSLIFSRISSGQYWNAHFAILPRGEEGIGRAEEHALLQKQEAQWRIEWIQGAPQIQRTQNTTYTVAFVCPLLALPCRLGSLSPSFSLPHPGGSGFPWSLGSKSWGEPGWNPSCPIPATWSGVYTKAQSSSSKAKVVKAWSLEPNCLHLNPCFAVYKLGDLGPVTWIWGPQFPICNVENNNFVSNTWGFNELDYCPAHILSVNSYRCYCCDSGLRL